MREFQNVTLDLLPKVASEMRNEIPPFSLVILKGEVGAGKTTLVKALCQVATSPTYALINEYKEFIHLDLYRLQKSSDLEHLELSLYLESGKPLLVEWGSDYLSELLDFMPQKSLAIEIELIEGPSSDSRHIRLKRINSRVNK